MPSRDIADEPDWEEVTTLPQFRERVSGQFGVIVIKDSTDVLPMRAFPFPGRPRHTESYIAELSATARRRGHRRRRLGPAPGRAAPTRRRARLTIA